MTKTLPDHPQQPGKPTYRGFDQSGVRGYNERLILLLLRQYGSLTRAEIARISGLSAQTISVIIRALEKDGLVGQGDLQRGRVGQPSLPMSLNADGVFSLGLKIGRHSCDLVLIDFLGNIRSVMTMTYNWPVLDNIIGFTIAGVERCTAELSVEQRKRIAGLGITLPTKLWERAGDAGAPETDIAPWINPDLPAILNQYFSFPILQQNDGNAACGAELTFGKPDHADFIYFYISSSIDGGVVLNNTLHYGRNGNAGSLSAIPLHMAVQDDHTQRRPTQLSDTVSLLVLERELHRAGFDTSQLWESPEAWDISNQIMENWIDLTARSLAHAITCAAAVFNFSAAIIDGWLPVRLRQRIITATHQQMTRYGWENIHLPAIISGTIGMNAKALGAARLPLLDKYLFDQNVLFKNKM